MPVVVVVGDTPQSGVFEINYAAANNVWGGAKIND